MSFNAAELVATIRLDGLDSVGRDLTKVRGELTATDAAATKVGRAAKDAFVTASAQIGTATVAAGAFIGKLAATGVAYNQLQQTSRAALRTLLGGAEQANAQMDKLEAFARNSPFSKSVFIQAQQQLIGFGFEAQKVIPILDAVQNAVAAVGGSNQQISEIVSILAKIRSSGKLTAEDFNMLGERGLDAATLLGAGFGKSAAEIRQSVTDGTLDAAEAIDVLVAQMGSKFAGGAAGVKETMAGTADRIKAATRDIGAALAEPFVAKNGGGLAVTWGNQVADVLRAVESHVGPVVSILTGRAAPAFAQITELLDRARVQVRSWDSSRLEGFLDSLGQHGPAVAAVAGAVLGMNAQLLRSIPIIGALVPGFGPLTGILAGIAATSPEVRAGLASVMDAARPLATVAADLARVVSASLNAALPIAADGLRLVASVARPLVDLLSQVPAPVLVAVGAFVALQAASKPLTAVLEGAGKGIQFVMQHMQASAAVTEAMGGQVTVLGTAFRATGSMATSLGNSMKAAFISNPVGIALIAVSTAAAILTAAFSAQAEAAQDTKERIQGYKDTLDQTSGAILRATRAQVEKNLADADARSKAEQLGVSYTDLVDAILGQPEAIKKVTAAIEENGKAYSATTGVQAGYTPVAQDLIRIFNDQSEAISSAAEETRRDADEKRKNAASMSELARSNTRMNEALAIARDVTRDATERLKALKLALDELNGGTKSQADVTRDLNEQTDRLREVLTATNEAGDKLAPGLINAAGAIDTTSAAGRALYDEVGRLNDQMLDAILLADKEAKARGESGVAAEEARAIYERFSWQLRNLQTEAGLSNEQMDGLIRTMISTPEIVAFAVQDDGSVDAAKLRLVELAQQIIETPDGQFDVSSDDFPGLQEALRLLGVNITSLPPGTVRVQKDDGSFQSVEQALNSLARNRISAMYAEVRYANGPGGSGGLTRASGGPIFGAGTATSDSVPVMASNGEHMWTAAETNAVGGHGAMLRLRKAALAGVLHLAEGGPVLRRDALPPSEPIILRTSAPAAVGSSATAAAPAPDFRELAEELARVLAEHPRMQVVQNYPIHTNPLADAQEAAALYNAGG